MATQCSEVSRGVDQSVWLGNRLMSRAAGELHLFGVLLGAHSGSVGYVPAADVAALPQEVRSAVDELVDIGLWSRAAGGWAIDPTQAARTMRAALERLNDPTLCAATGAGHANDGAGRCAECGAELVSAFR
jgi:hypothetical protein